MPNNRPPDPTASIDAPEPPHLPHPATLPSRTTPVPPPPWQPQPDPIPAPPPATPTPPPWDPPPRPHALDLHPGDIVLGAWRLLYIAGEGAAGVTWRASPLDGSPDVALKAVLSGGPGSRQHDNLLREAMLLRQLRHPTVVRYLGVIDMPGTAVTWLIMEWVEGGDLSDWIARHAPVGPTRARYLMLQLVDALEFLHSRDVIHRDLKPANILVRPTLEGPPRLCVADFGISRRMVDGAAPATRPAGTPGYAPPEIWGSAPLTAAADLFSMGAILWYLLTGHEAVPRPGDSSPRAAHLSSSLRDLVPPGSEDLARLAIALLAAAPADRPSLEQVREALERPSPADVVSGGTLLPKDTSPPLPPHAATTDILEPPPPRGLPLLGIAAVLAAMALSCGASWLIFSGSRAPSVAVQPAPATEAEGAVSPPPAAVAPPPPEPVAEPTPAPVRVPAAPAVAAAEPTRIVAPALPIGELRVGLRAPAGLPADALLVVIGPDGRTTRTPSTSATVTNTESGTAIVQVRGATGVVAEAHCTLPAGDVVRVFCSSPASDFKGLHCDVR